MQLSQIAGAMPTIQKLLDSSLKVTIEFRLAKFAKEVEPHMESYEKLRGELLEKYGTLDSTEEDGQSRYIFENGQAEKFTAELTKLLDEEIDLKVKKFKISDLKDAELTPRDILSLEWALSDK